MLGLLARGDGEAFICQAKASAELWQFAICARLITELQAGGWLPPCMS
jgi:hypothetical protein